MLSIPKETLCEIPGCTHLATISAQDQLHLFGWGTSCRRYSSLRFGPSLLPNPRTKPSTLQARKRSSANATSLYVTIFCDEEHAPD